MSETVLRLLLLVLWLVGTGWGAYRKGYNPLFFVIGGILSLLVLSFLPFTNRFNPPTPAELSARSRGNWIGLVCSLGSGLLAASMFTVR